MPHRESGGYMMDPIQRRPSSDDESVKIIETPSQLNLRLTKEFRRKFRIFTLLLFSLLILVSFAYFVALIFFWQRWPEIEKLTNMYSGFFGFATATVLNIIASWAGIASFNDNGSEWMDPMRSSAVIMLLIASILFNIVFPTSVLTPFEIDSRKRVLTIPLPDCPDLKKDLKGVPVPECDYSEQVTLCLYVMFPLILLELITLISYIYMKSQQTEDYNLTKLNDEATLRSAKDDTDDGADDDGDMTIAVDALDTYTTVANAANVGGPIYPQNQEPGSQPRFGVNRRSSYGGDQFYWAQPQSSGMGKSSDVVKSQSTPFRSGGSGGQNQYQYE